MTQEYRSGRSPGGTSGQAGGAVQRSAGKQSRTARLAGARGAPVEAPYVGMGALQFDLAPPSPTAPAAYDDPFGLHLEGSTAHATAERGVEGSGTTLPHLNIIQGAFGRHDVSGVSAHVGGAAGQAADQLGAEAYATGNAVGFASPPSLHLAAHEAAHVVQQRAGVSLKGGVGESGDAYERHADLVADTVVAGRSAEAVLDQGPGGGAGGATSAGPAIQRQEKPAAAAASQPAAPAPAPATDPATAPSPDDTEGDKLRTATLAAAKQRLVEKTEIVSEAKISDQREGMVRLKIMDGVDLRVPLGTPMKNFTTCIEFAGQTFKDGSKASGADGKALGKFMLMFNKETELHLQIDAFKAILERFQAPYDTAEAEKTKAEGEIEAIKEPTGDKATDAKNKALASAKAKYIEALDGQMDTLKAQIDKFNAKMAKASAELEGVEEKNDAWIKPAALAGGARPRPGEQILLGAASAQPYGLKGSKVTLAKNSFKHIAVLESREPHDAKDGGSWEKWTTIDGGGIIPTGKSIYVTMDDPYTVQWAEPGTNPWAAGNTCLLGWIDADQLVESGRPDAAPAG